MLLNPNYYWYNGKKHFLNLNTQKIFLILGEGVDKSALSNDLQIEEDKIEDINRLSLGSSIIVHRDQDIKDAKIYDYNWTIITVSDPQKDILSEMVLYYSPVIPPKKESF